MRRAQLGIREAQKLNKRVPFTLPVRPLHAPEDSTAREPMALELVGVMSLRVRDVHVMVNAFTGSTERFALVYAGGKLRPTAELSTRARLDSGKNDTRSRIAHGLVEHLDTPNGPDTMTDLLLAWSQQCHDHDIPLSDVAQRALALAWAAKHHLPQRLTEALRDQASTWDGPIEDLGHALLAATSH